MTSILFDQDHRKRGDRTLVLKPMLKSATSTRDHDAGLHEAVGLAEAIDLCVVEAASLNLQRALPATLLGRGQVDHYGGLIASLEIALVVIDHSLNPVQQRNLEKAWKCKVIDRTGLILEIFGARARTKEGQLQVELAALEYQKSRLVRSWTHLERQRGGFGFLGGPGESQLEIDRRLISKRILKLKEELKQVRRTRGLQREARQRAEHPTIALIGYTNAGKSSLFNRLTGSDQIAKDMLFATLDPAMRGLKLPGGCEAILSDTVGFISQLPTHLILAFRATLEEVQTADVILHVRDVFHQETGPQKEAVLGILSDLGIRADDERLIEVLNKTDLLDPRDRDQLKSIAVRMTWDATHAPEELQGAGSRALGGTVAVSALTGEGIPDLLELLEEKLARRGEIYEIDVNVANGAALAWLYAHGKVLKRRTTRTHTHLRIRMNVADFGRFQSRFLENDHVVH